MRGKICQAAQTNGRVKSLELQTQPGLHIGGVIKRFFMINVYPLYEEELHEMSNTCNCRPSVQFENGSMIVVHNEIVKALPFDEAVKENTESLFEIWTSGGATKEEIKDLMKTAIEDEEYEVAICIKEVLKRIDAS